jgi:hypothetical protein
VTKLPHTEILSPRLKWGPKEFRDHHLSDELDENLLFDPRCPRCQEDFARTPGYMDCLWGVMPSKNRD